MGLRSKAVADAEVASMKGRSRRTGNVMGWSNTAMAARPQ